MLRNVLERNDLLSRVYLHYLELMLFRLLIYKTVKSNFTYLPLLRNLMVLGESVATWIYNTILVL